MINARNIFGLILIISMCVYFIFGNANNHYWNGLYFTTWNLTNVYLCYLVINKYRDKLLNIIMKIILGVSVFKSIFSIYSFFDVKIYSKINDSYHAGGVIVSCVLIFLIYKRYERLVKR